MEESKEVLKLIYNKLGTIDYKIQNIVASSDSVADYIYLKEFYEEHKENCKYNPKFFPGLSYKIKELGVTMLLFKSAKINCTGAKTLETIDKAYKYIRKILSKKYKIKNVPYVVQNMVVVMDFKEKLNLYQIYHNLYDESIEYDPEQFPGIIYKFNSSMTFLIFYSGKMVLTGAKKKTRYN